VIFGATGLIGKGVLLEALDAEDVTEVLTVGRREVDVEHPKLTQVAHDDFLDFASLVDRFRELDACFWCLGISSTGVDEASYTKVTYDFTMAAAEALYEASPDLCFCFVSGAGTDRDARAMWARVKAKTEDALREVGFGNVVLFRPAYIRPMRGVKSRTRLYRVLNPPMLLLNPLLRRMGGATSTVEIGKAMLAAARGEAGSDVLDSKGINALAARG